MRAKRTQTKKPNKIRMVIIAAIIIVIIVVGFLVLGKIKNKKSNLNNNYISKNTIDVNEISTESEIKAYVFKTQNNEIVTDGAKYNSSIKVYCEKGSIESITYNGSKFEGTELNEDGIYVITMKTENNLPNTVVKIEIDTVVPTLLIDGEAVIGVGELYGLETKVTLKDGKGIDKFTKALLVECNSNGEIINTKEPINITEDLKNDGYTFTQKGIYKIQLLDENGNQIEFVGKDNAFKIR